MDFEYFIIVLSGAILTVQTQLIFELSEKCVDNEQQTIKYWDPQASSVKKFVDLGLGTKEQYNFSALSNKLLGQAQPKQFQSDDDEQPTGWWWGSKCTPIYDESNPPKVINTTCDSSASITSNILSEMPRSYKKSIKIHGNNYNFYAATAESGKYDTSTTPTSDSLCPAGWQLPDEGALGDATKKSWGNLLGNAYHYLTANGTQTDENSPFGSAKEAGRRIRRLPISIANGGTYHWHNAAIISQSSIAEIWSNRPDGQRLAYYLNIATVTNGFIDTRYHSEKVYGFLMRCVKRD